MSSDQIDNAVTEYLRELDLRLTGLPVLQRRELLADLQAHITNERAERGAVTETDLLEILERLGSPEVVAAAAYDEAGLLAPREPVLSYAGSSRAAVAPLPTVAPPPDSPPPAFGPYPPRGSFDRAPDDFGRPGAWPPLTPPPAPAKADGTGLRIVIAVAIGTVVLVLLGCLAGAFFLTSNSSPAEPTTVTVPAERPGPDVVEQAPPQPDPPTVD